MQTNQRSSRLSEGPQPPPLSHSMIARLELGENDPDTFREVIDDLTVQNKKLKRQVRQYERLHTNQLAHDGLFELRIRNLPPGKKHELEVTLQNFASTVQSSQQRPAQGPAVRGRNPPIEACSKNEKPTPSSSPYTRPPDSGYASVSPARDPAKDMSVPHGNTLDRVYKQMAPAMEQVSQITNHGTVQAVYSPNVAGISDRSKKRIIVRRLEELSLRNEADEVTLDESNGRSKVPRRLLKRSDKLESSQRSPSPNCLRYSQDRGATSPVASFSSQPHHEWIFLNLLINAAQLHTLNVTPEFVRQAIRTDSDKLLLSEDGCKVRWRGTAEHTVIIPDGPNDNLAKGDASQSAVPQSTSIDQPEQWSGGNYAAPMHPLQKNRSTADGGIDSPQLAKTYRAIAPRKVLTTGLHYKPLFAHPARHQRRSNRSSDDGSIGSSGPSSDTEENYTTNFSRNGPDPSNGPLIFFDKEPFFLDLSADTADVDHITLPSYSKSAAEPLGDLRVAHKASQSHETYQAVALATDSDRSWRRRAHSKGLTQSPLLRVHNDYPAYSADDLDDRPQIHLEASGIGGICLDDNFAIEVKMQKPSTPDLPLPCPAIHHRLHTALSASIHRATTDTRIRSHHIISTKTTHLPPSPLPPPSYVYPAFSSSSSGSEAGYATLENSDSESELELRRVSLSPRMRTWFEQKYHADSQGGLAGAREDSMSDVGWGSIGDDEDSEIDD